MESILIPLRLPVHNGLPNQFLGDEWGNVWYREFTIESRDEFIKLSMIRRHDGADSSVALLNRGRIGVMMPGDLISVGDCPSDAKIDFVLVPKLQDDLDAQSNADSEKVNIISKDATYSVSKSLLLRHSEYFRCMFASQFREALTNGINKRDLPASTVAAFVEYLERDTISCGLADLVRLGHLVHPWEMPRLVRRIELEICAHFDRNESDDDWQSALVLGSIFKSRWIARAFANRLPFQEKSSEGAV